MHTYISSIDKLSRIITWFVATLAVLPSISGYFVFLKDGKDMDGALYLLCAPIFILVLIGAMYLLKPLSVEVSNSSLIIHRLFKTVTIQFSDIKSIRMAEEGEMIGVIRTFGNGGLFGYTGKYWNKKLGSMTWYCTQRKNYILIEKQDNKRVVITPDEPVNFIKDIESVKPQLIVN